MPQTEQVPCMGLPKKCSMPIRRGYGGRTYGGHAYADQLVLSLRIRDDAWANDRFRNGGHERKSRAAYVDTAAGFASGMERLTNMPAANLSLLVLSRHGRRASGGYRAT